MSSDVPKLTHADVLRIIERDFPVEERSEVWNRLKQYKNLLRPAATDDENARVHLAILKLCDGQLSHVCKLVDQAYQDFRDVLSPAEYPEFHKIGFVGIDRLTPQEKDELIKRDWDQYHKWLDRR